MPMASATPMSQAGKTKGSPATKQTRPETQSAKMPPSSTAGIMSSALFQRSATVKTAKPVAEQSAKRLPCQ